MTGLTAAPDWLTRAPIAHRGWHDRAAGRAENSISAFAAAVEAGFAIECDVQPSSTGEPMVFHDATLDRMTAVSGPIRDHAPHALADILLQNTQDGIHTLRRHLDDVAGRVPVVVELKGQERDNAAFAEAVADAVAGYDGPLALMSFDHELCEAFARFAPDRPRGLTAEGSEEAHQAHLEAMRTFDLQFVSYHVDALPDAFVAQMREMGLPVITWTVRTEEQCALTAAHADQMTFEGFDPRALESA